MDNQSESFVFSDLFSAGTITIPLSDAIQLSTWHPEDPSLAQQPLDFLSTLGTHEYHKLLQSLSWLIVKNFVRIQYLSAHEILYIRVYVIPEDLECVNTLLYQRHHYVKEGAKEAALKHLRIVLSNVNQSPSAWDGSSAGVISGDFLSEQMDQRTLSELYQSLNSPEPRPLDSIPPELAPYDLAQSFYSTTLKTELHSYQQRTVTMMLERECPDLYSPILPDPTMETAVELQPTHVSPLFLQIHSVASPSTDFFIQPSKLTIRRRPPSYSMIKGGILCEEMGTGKTLICISLILATLDHLSQPAKSKDDEPIQTSQWAADGSDNHEEGEFPSLKELCYYRMRTCPRSAPWRQLQAAFPDHLWDEITDTGRRPYYYSMADPDQTITCNESRRRITENLTVKIWLTNATLVIVPAILLEQWRAEIGKHVIEGSLRWHVIDAKATELPAVETMAEHWDLILVSQERLINERKKSSDLPFEKIHWLRIIVDEGNVCANKSAIMTYVGGLRADRRWIVTGTPTTNLITVDTDTSTTSFTSGEVLVEEALTVGKSKSALSQCKEDLNKLNSMICGFLGANVPPMIGGYLQSFPRCGDDESLFKTHVISPSLDGTWGGIKVLENVMSHFLIRHRIEDIEKDVALPPKTRQTVLLDMDPFQAITYNVMLSLVVVNAVDSERADKDYFFHPDNHKFRAILILNLSQTCLWRAERELDNNLTEWLRVSTNSVRKAVALAQQRHGLERDLQLVQQAHLIQKDAVSNLAWRCMMRNEQLPFRVYSLPKDLQENWLRIRDPYNQRCAVNQESNVEEESMCFLTDIPDFRQAGQDCRLNIPSMKYEGDIRYESIMKRHGAFRSDYVHTSSETHTLSSPIKALKSKSKSRSRNATKFTSPRSIVSGTAAKSGGFSPSKSARRPAQEAQSILKPVEVGRITSRIYSDNPLLAMRIGGSTSPKINYIISQVLLNSSDKFLIFSDSPLSLEYIREALQVARIPCLSLHGRSARDCEALVQLFELNGTYRALLLLLEQGARGLNLTSANKVIFTEPVWRADVEAQAIKRVHRIGQYRPVDITVLAMKGTFEEEMLRRGPNHEKLMENDEVMMNFLKNPKFIQPTSPNKELDTLINFPMFDVPNVVDRPSVRKTVSFLLTPSPEPEDSYSFSFPKPIFSDPLQNSPATLTTSFGGETAQPKFTIRIPPAHKRQAVEDSDPSAVDPSTHKKRKVTLHE